MSEWVEKARNTAKSWVGRRDRVSEEIKRMIDTRDSEKAKSALIADLKAQLGQCDSLKQSAVQTGDKMAFDEANNVLVTTQKMLSTVEKMDRTEATLRQIDVLMHTTNRAWERFEAFVDVCASRIAKEHKKGIFTPEGAKHVREVTARAATVMQKVHVASDDISRYWVDISSGIPSDSKSDEEWRLRRDQYLQNLKDQGLPIS